MVGRRNWCHPFFFSPFSLSHLLSAFFPKSQSAFTQRSENSADISAFHHTRVKSDQNTAGKKKLMKNLFFFLFNGVLQRLLFVFVPSLSLCVCNNINQRGLFKTTVWFMLLHTRLIIRALASSSFRLGFAHFLQTRSRSFCSKKRGKKGKQSAS